MGERNKYLEAVILSVRQQGESNRSVSVFAPEKGIFYCTLYGGPKSRLRAMVQPFNFGVLYFYEDEQKGTYKITDFDVKKAHLSLRTSLFKMYAANLCTEILIKTHCAGDYKNSFKLYSAVLDGIDFCSENEARLGLIRFLWRYLDLLGVQPDVKECSLCRNFLLEEKTRKYYVLSSNSFVCSDCLNSLSQEDKKTAENFSVDVYGLTYLAAINELSPAKVRSMEIDSAIVFELKNIVYYLIEHACGTSLVTMKDGAGIL